MLRSWSALFCFIPVKAFSIEFCTTGEDSPWAQSLAGTDRCAVSLLTAVVILPPAVELCLKVAWMESRKMKTRLSMFQENVCV